MNGNKYLLDTNILLYILGNKIDLNDLPLGEFLLSFINELEILSYPSVSSAEENIIKNLFNEIPIIGIDELIKNKTIEIKRKYKIKLPDAIIAATAIVNNAALLTNDKDFSKIKEIQVNMIKLK